MDSHDTPAIKTDSNKPANDEDGSFPEFVAKEKYLKLKQRFAALRQVSHIEI
jgi:hypothetical protein